MKAMLGVVSLLVALAVVGLVAVRQLKAGGHAAAPASAESVPAVPSMSGSGTLREQAVQLENKVANDAIKAMNQAAVERKEAAEK